MKSPMTVLGLGLLLMLCVTSKPAFATLGQKVDSVGRDSAALSAEKKNTTSGDKYSIHEIVSQGTTVREFVNNGGVVFAVGWNGLVNPDLTVLLGSYTPDYKKAKGNLQRRHGQKGSKIKGDRVVVETWGQMRNLCGRAYDPALIPQGVELDEIR